MMPDASLCACGFVHLPMRIRSDPELWLQPTDSPRGPAAQVASDAYQGPAQDGPNHTALCWAVTTKQNATLLNLW